MRAGEVVELERRGSQADAYHGPKCAPAPERQLGGMVRHWTCVRGGQYAGRGTEAGEALRGCVGRCSLRRDYALLTNRGLFTLGDSHIARSNGSSHESREASSGARLGDACRRCRQTLRS